MKRTMVLFLLTALLITGYDCSVVNCYGTRTFSGSIEKICVSYEVNIMSNETSSTNEQVATLTARVYALVRTCPVGRVTTYGWLAKAVGYPRGARMVGWFMNECPKDVPAQRVINSKGELSGSWAFGQKGRMRQLLEAEDVEFTEEGKVNLKRYCWDPARD